MNPSDIFEFPPQPLGWASVTARSQLGTQITPGTAQPNFSTVVARTGQFASAADQVWAIDLPSYAGAGDNLINVRAQIVWGAAGVSDTAVIDYPAAGTSVWVRGTDVQVTLFGTPIDGTTTIGAWLTPVAGSSRPMTATLTDPEFSVDAHSNHPPSTVPTRARAFRLIFIDPPGGVDIDSEITLTQRRNDTAIVGTDVWGADTVLLTRDQSDSLPTSRAQWYPLAPEAQLLEVFNLSSVRVAIRIQWSLELA